jgi:NADPH2:quinone reductase
MPNTMRAVRAHAPGGLDVIVVDELPIPRPGPGWILVRMEAAGLNFSDTMRRQDRYGATTFPVIFGSEATGEVVALGEGVTRVRPGDRVTGVIPGRRGGYADYVLMSADHVAAAPERLSAVEAMTIPNQGATAWCLLHDMARIAPGDRVLVNAAGGGVGLWAIQLARAAGAGTIVGLASTPEKRQAAVQAGADLALDTAEMAWADQARAAAAGGFDIFLDSIGGPLFGPSLELTVPFSRSVCYGLSSGKPVTLSPSSQLAFGCRTLAGFHLDQVMAKPERFRGVLEKLFALLAAGTVRPWVAAVFPLAEAREAQAFLESRAAVGKVVLTP